MIHGFSSRRPGGIIFTKIVCLDENIISKMEDMAYRYDKYNTLISIYFASFIHLTEKEYDKFMNEFDIILVDSKQELNMLKKLLL